VRSRAPSVVRSAAQNIPGGGRQTFRNFGPGGVEDEQIYKPIRKLKSGKYRLYSRKKDPKTGKRKNLGTFDTREEAEKHERAVQFFKRKG
jgi:hypothetical protein